MPDGGNSEVEGATQGDVLEEAELLEQSERYLWAFDSAILEAVGSSKAIAVRNDGAWLDQNELEDAISRLDIVGGNDLVFNYTNDNDKYKIRRTHHLIIISRDVKDESGEIVGSKKAWVEGATKDNPNGNIEFRVSEGEEVRKNTNNAEAINELNGMLNEFGGQILI